MERLKLRRRPDIDLGIGFSGVSSVSLDGIDYSIILNSSVDTTQCLVEIYIFIIMMRISIRPLRCSSIWSSIYYIYLVE
jgi:hypothetical protein